MWPSIQYPSITSEEAQAVYWDSFHFCSCKTDDAGNPLPKSVPTPEDFAEYRLLAKEYDKLLTTKGLENRLKARRYEKLHRFYDWRHQIFSEVSLQGLKAADGSILLPDIFHEVGETPYSYDCETAIVPVSNGKAWGLILAGNNPIMLTQFQFKTILVERYSDNMFFVQGFDDKWGALCLDWVRSNNVDSPILIPLNYVTVLRALMPLEFDEIYEVCFCPEGGPDIYWITRKGEKYGILTKSEYTPAIYDEIDFNDKKCQFLVKRRKEQTRYRHLDYYDLNASRSK